jgi:hypothetical protein
MEFLRCEQSICWKDRDAAGRRDVTILNNRDDNRPTEYTCTFVCQELRVGFIAPSSFRRRYDIDHRSNNCFGTHFAVQKHCEPSEIRLPESLAISLLVTSNELHIKRHRTLKHQTTEPVAGPLIAAFQPSTGRRLQIGNTGFSFNVKFITHLFLMPSNSNWSRLAFLKLCQLAALAKKCDERNSFS